MREIRAVGLLALGMGLWPAPPAAAQHGDHAAPSSRFAVQAGAHGVGLLTHVSPILRGEAMTEAYLTQPTLMGRLSALDGVLTVQGTVSLEALTLDRGELGAGSYGEGYVDRRHPHTYLHELVLTAGGVAGPVAVSSTVGRGFAPFGTDDPMMRPFVKFPVNHHLGQILERTIVTGAVRGGPLLVEAGVFSGNEPADATDIGRRDRFADSWAARVTLLPVPGVEVQASRAWVVSPELPVGGGWDQRKWSASARYDRAHDVGRVYALAEWKRTTEVSRDRDVFSFGSVLGEAALTRGAWTPAVRVEVTERPEEERLVNPFRSQWPHADTHMLGITTWTTVGARLERASRIGGLRLSPFIEASVAAVDGDPQDIFEPESFYGDTRIWTFNIGARIGAGWHTPRMGRYGAAVVNASHEH